MATMPTITIKVIDLPEVRVALTEAYEAGVEQEREQVREALQMAALALASGHGLDEAEFAVDAALRGIDHDCRHTR